VQTHRIVGGDMQRILSPIVNITARLKLARQWPVDASCGSRSL